MVFTPKNFRVYRAVRQRLRILTENEIEQKIEQKIEQNIDQKIDQNIDQKIEQNIELKIQHQSQRFNRLLLQQRVLLTRYFNRQINCRPAPKPKFADGLDKTLAFIQSAAPEAYKLWLKCQAEGKKAYIGTPIDSCSVVGHPHAELFRDFIYPYLNGNILDIGCGPQDIPLYLQGIPTECIAGLDPIGSAADHPFVFYKGLAELYPGMMPCLTVWLLLLL